MLNAERHRVLVLGGGLAGLSAGLVLARAGLSLAVLERDPAVGGLAKTVVRGAFRFDLGGHRFHTTDQRVEAFARGLMDGEWATVRRRSRILLGDRCVAYPLRPLDALAGVGLPAAFRMLAGYGWERVRARVRPSPPRSLEDWVVSRFGRALFEAYFKGYSEKVWGIDCRRISMEWVEQRIQGLSLGLALRHALLGSGGPATLVEEFLYPPLGIGRIAERLAEEVERGHQVLTSTAVRRVEHRGGRIRRVIAAEGGQARAFAADEFVSTLPVTALVRLLSPRAPDDVREAAARLRYRGLAIVTVMVDRERVTDQTWTYLPDPRIPFGRLHEPTNWSPRMAPPGQTLLVTEHFCFAGDPTWRAADEDLAEVTIDHLVRLGILQRREVVGSAAVRVPAAYPLFEVGYRRHVEKIRAYLGGFANLALAGRAGTFAYLNMDQAIASGLAAGEAVIARAAGVPAERDRRGALATVGA